MLLDACPTRWKPPPASRRDVAPASRRLGTANRRSRTGTRSRGDWPRRLHRLLPALWLPPACLCWRPDGALRLNRLKMYLAANISNPFMAPLLHSDGASDRRLGQARSPARAHARRGQEHRSLELRRRSHRRQPGRRRGACGPERSRHVSCGPYWRATIRRSPRCVRRAADRYVSTSITAWEFARGKLRGDPLYRTVADRVRASCRRDARGRRLRSGADAGAARRVRRGVGGPGPGRRPGRRRGVRPAGRHRNTASRRGDRPPGARRRGGDRRRRCAHARAGRSARRAVLRRASHDAGRGSGAAAGVHGRGPRAAAG